MFDKNSRATGKRWEGGKGLAFVWGNLALGIRCVYRVNGIPSPEIGVLTHGEAFRAIFCSSIVWEGRYEIRSKLTVVFSCCSIKYNTLLHSSSYQNFV